MKEIAIIAPTASGKTTLSIELAHKTNSIILSLDSLSIYKEVNIASAKPTVQERDGIIHFGIDEINCNDNFDVMEFIELYYKAKQYAIDNSKNLIIVGGTGFYLKAMVDGISKVPTCSPQVINKVKIKLEDIDEAYKYMRNIDEDYMKRIERNDKYRIEKALCIYMQTKKIPTIYFKENQPNPIIKDIPIYEIDISVDELRKRIRKRTTLMINNGLIDEVIFLEKKYGREYNCMHSIGIVEVLEYLDGKINKHQLEDKIVINTARLAKRQRTFNNGQFQNVIKQDINSLRKILKI